MGRDKIIKDPHLVINLHKEGKTINEIAEELAISEKTVRRVFKREGYKTPRGRKKGKSIDTSCVVKWVKEHPDTVLPRSLKAINDLTGCSYDSIKAYFYRKRKVIKESIANLPDLREYPIKVRHDGEIYDFRDIRSYTLSVDYLTETIKILAQLPNGQKKEFQLHLHSLRKSLDSLGSS